MPNLSKTALAAGLLALMCACGSSSGNNGSSGDGGAGDDGGGDASASGGSSSGASSSGAGSSSSGGSGGAGGSSGGSSGSAGGSSGGSSGSAGGSSGGSSGAGASGGGSGSGSGSSSGSGSGGGTDAGGSSGGVDPVKAARSQCVQIINMYRATLSPPSPPLTEDTSKESCVDGQAKTDYTAMTPHKGFGACSEFAQDECPGWSGAPGDVTKNCLAAMWKEGPPPAGQDNHWLNMSNKSYTHVACGYYQTPSGDWWATQDFW